MVNKLRVTRESTFLDKAKYQLFNVNNLDRNVLYAAGVAWIGIAGYAAALGEYLGAGVVALTSPAWFGVGYQRQRWRNEDIKEIRKNVKEYQARRDAFGIESRDD